MFKLAAVLAATVSVMSTLSSQTTSHPEEPEFTLYASSELVVLNVAVQDTHGTNIRGLMAQDFKVYEDGHPQIIKQFASEDRPVTIGIVVDASGSMRTKQSEVVAAALSFVRASNPTDQTFVINFNDRALPGLPPDVPFSSDPGQLRTALLGRKTEGKTALYDALVLAAEHLSKGKWENKAVLLISDGGDNYSTHSFSEAVRALRMSGATVYSIAVFDPEEHEHNLGILHRLAKMSGGEAFAPMDISEINALCIRIAQDIRASYTLAYIPPLPDQHSVFRKIKVVVVTNGGGKFKARTRSGYILEEL